jgi:hypothetical protein
MEKVYGRTMKEEDGSYILEIPSRITEKLDKGDYEQQILVNGEVIKTISITVK